MGALSRSPSPMTIVPARSTSSNVLRIASTAAWSAALLSPRPMWRADAIAAASVTRTISSASSPSMAPLVAVVPLAGEHHREMVTVGDFDGHLIADRAAGLDDCGHAALSGELDGVGKREVRVRREHR